jgi:hypothetical protein
MSTLADNAMLVARAALQSAAASRALSVPSASSCKTVVRSRGDIFHRSLSIDENSQFEGSSRRVENPTEPSSSVDAKGPQKDPQKKDLAPAPL